MKIYGYLFKIVSEKGEWGYVAYAPGVGGVYEEGATEKQAVSNAYEAACAILETRLERNDPITEDSPYLIVLTAPPNLQYITSAKEIPDAYIATPRCLAPAGAH
jgi:predicted RNase H-like HicB family nuclease